MNINQVRNWCALYLPVVKVISSELGPNPAKLNAEAVTLYSVLLSSPDKVSEMVSPGAKGPARRLWGSPGGLVKLNTMPTMGGVPSGDSCTSTVTEKEVEERRERVGALERTAVGV